MQQWHVWLAKLVILDALTSTYDFPEEKKTELNKAFQLLKSNAAMDQAVNNLKLREALKQTAQAANQSQLPPAGSSEEPSSDKNLQISDREATKEEAVAGTPQQEEIQPIEEAQNG
jgi:hypothetical protein